MTEKLPELFAESATEEHALRPATREVLRMERKINSVSRLSLAMLFSLISG